MKDLRAGSELINTPSRSGAVVQACSPLLTAQDYLEGVLKFGLRLVTPYLFRLPGVGKAAAAKLKEKG